MWHGCGLVYRDDQVIFPGHNGILSMTAGKPEGIRSTAHPELVAIAAFRVRVLLKSGRLGINSLCGGLFHPFGIDELLTLPCSILKIEHTQAEIVFGRRGNAGSSMDAVFKGEPPQFVHFQADFFKNILG